MLSAWRWHLIPQLGSSGPAPSAHHPISWLQSQVRSITCAPPPLSWRSQVPLAPCSVPLLCWSSSQKAGISEKNYKSVKGCESVARGGDTRGEHAKDHLMVGAAAGTAARACVLVPQPAALRPLLWGFPVGFLPWVWLTPSLATGDWFHLQLFPLCDGQWLGPRFQARVTGWPLCQPALPPWVNSQSHLISRMKDTFTPLIAGNYKGLRSSVLGTVDKDHMFISHSK